MELVTRLPGAITISNQLDALSGCYLPTNRIAYQPAPSAFICLFSRVKCHTRPLWIFRVPKLIDNTKPQPQHQNNIENWFYQPFATYAPNGNNMAIDKNTSVPVAILFATQVLRFWFNYVINITQRRHSHTAVACNQQLATGNWQVATATISRLLAAIWKMYAQQP